MSWTTTWQGLKDHMSRVGTVTRADILTRRDGKSAGCGIVEYSDPHDAERAIAELTDTDLDGRDIFVREDREGGSRGPGGAAAAAVARPAAGAPSRGGASNTRVYVNNLSWDVDWRRESSARPVLAGSALRCRGKLPFPPLSCHPRPQS